MSMDASPYPVAPEPGPPSAGTSGRATASLVLGILGFVCCQLFGPVAWYLGAQERKAIRAGLSSPAGDGVALAGMIIGIVVTGMLVLGILVTLLWLFIFGGLAALGVLAGNH